MQLDDLTCNIFIGEDEKQWPDEHNAIERVVIYNRLLYAVGAMEIVLNDATGQIGNAFKIEDQTPIRIDTGKGLDIESWKFRAVKVVRMGAKAYHIFGIGNQVKYMQNANTGHFEETSSDAIKKIAGECGMEIIADATSDKMVWLGYGRKMYEFATSIALRGYASDKSLMWLACYKDKLYYKDLNAIDPSKPTALFSQTGVGSGTATGYVIHRIEPISMAGVYNSMGGYGSVAVDQTISDEKSTSHKDVEVKQRADKVQLNPEVQALVTTAPTATALLRSDNTHDKYNKALYQNIRGFGQLSEWVVLTTPQQTKVGLLDIVEVSAGAINAGSKDPMDNQNNSFDGKYLVDTRNIQIEKHWYWETFILRREGIKKAS